MVHSAITYLLRDGGGRDPFVCLVNRSFSSGPPSQSTPSVQARLIEGLVRCRLRGTNPPGEVRPR